MTRSATMSRCGYQRYAWHQHFAKVAEDLTGFGQRFQDRECGTNVAFLDHVINRFFFNMCADMDHVVRDDCQVEAQQVGFRSGK